MPETPNIDARPETVFDPDRVVGEGSGVTVDISVNWRFISEGEDFVLSYSTGHVERASTELEHDDAAASEEPVFLDSILPLQSSVLAPGLSMPVPAP